MITYELAKELRDNGFPLSVHIPSRDGSDRFCNELENDDNYLNLPTLSELIEACGNDFEYLKRYKADGEWEAGGLKYESDGKTPEEAVAKLWLELNKNS